MRAKSKKARSGQSAKKANDASCRPDDAANGKADPTDHKGAAPDEIGARDYGRIARKVFELGGTEADIAEALNVSRETIVRWRKSSPDFSKACMQGIEKANSEVQRSLFKMAIGYEHVVEDVRFHQGRAITIKYRKKEPPNLAAAKLWLLNRYSEKWNSEPEPEQKEGELARVFRAIEGSVMRPKYEDGTPEPYSILAGEAERCDKEVEIEKENEMVKVGLRPNLKEHRALYNLHYKK